MAIFAREFPDADAKILLLADIRRVFEVEAANALPSKTLIAALHGLDADWNEFHGVRGGQQPHKLKRPSSRPCCANSESGRARSGRRRGLPKAEAQRAIGVCSLKRHGAPIALKMPAHRHTLAKSRPYDL